MLNAFSVHGRYGIGLPMTAGKIFHVSSDTALSNRLQEQFPTDEDGVVRVHATIDAAQDASYGDSGADRGDIVFVYPGHTETWTTALTTTVSGMSIIGLGNGTLTPTITVNGAVDGFNIAAANQTIEHFRFAAPGTDAQTSVINVNAVDGVTIRDIVAIGSTTAKNIVDMITIVAGADYCTIENINFYNETVAVNSFISIEGACTDLTLKNIRCFGECATGGIIDAAKVTNLFMEDVRVATVGTTIPAITLDSNPTGMARNCFFAGTSTTIADDANLGNLMRVDNIKVLEEIDNSKSAMILPAVDAES
jgi:hypothetical protein